MLSLLAKLPLDGSISQHHQNDMLTHHAVLQHPYATPVKQALEMTVMQCTSQ